MVTAAQPEIANIAAVREALAERLLESATEAMNLFSIFLGDRLGYYQVLSADGALTPGELADRTGTNARYAREWLEQQAVSGILQVENPDAPPDARRFYLSAGHEEVLADSESLYYLAPLAQAVAGAVRPLDLLIQAYRQGTGVPFDAYGTDAREGVARLNRSMFLHELGPKWLPAVPELHERLLADPPARVADVGCGAGWSSIGLARNYPKVFVDGIDLDAASIELARVNAEKTGLSQRIHFHTRDAADSASERQYDLVTAFECIHDMSDPVGALSAMRRLVKEGGVVLVADERAGDSFSPDAGQPERLMYGFSVLHCLPVGMAQQPSAATGTVMRPDTLRRYAQGAGYRRVDILPIENYFFRFYRLVP